MDRALDRLDSPAYIHTGQCRFTWVTGEQWMCEQVYYTIYLLSSDVGSSSVSTGCHATVPWGGNWAECVWRTGEPWPLLSVPHPQLPWKDRFNCTCRVLTTATNIVRWHGARLSRMWRNEYLHLPPLSPSLPSSPLSLLPLSPLQVAWFHFPCVSSMPSSPVRQATTSSRWIDSVCCSIPAKRSATVTLSVGYSLQRHHNSRQYWAGFEPTTIWGSRQILRPTEGTHWVGSWITHTIIIST